MNIESQLNSSVYESLFDLLPQAVVLLDGELRVRLANKAASALFQVPQEQLGERPVSSLIRHRDIPKLILEFGEEPVKVIELHPEPDQEAHPSTILKITIVRLRSVTPVPKLTSDQEFRLLVLEDITAKVLLEEQLVQAEKLAGMGQLAEGIAHELGNPLSSVSSNLSYIRSVLTTNGHVTLMEPLDATLANLQQMHLLLRSLSEFTGQPQPHYEPANLHTLIRRSLVFIAKEAEQHGIELLVSFADPVPLCSVDGRAITQVLLNVFKNAIEAMPEGGRISVGTRLSPPVLEGNEALVIEIQDSGRGIAESELRKVFRPLYSTKPRGTGLGLSFCRQVIEEHGGEIHLSSQRGRGTTVTLLLPVRQDVTEGAAG